MAEDNATKRRVNKDIIAREVNLIGPDGQNVGIVNTSVALTLAMEAGLDLVEVNPNVHPPIVKMTDYSKLKYREQRREKEARKNARSQETREIRFRPTTDEHDMEIKLKQGRKFLEKGHRLRLTIQMRGREQSRREAAAITLSTAAEKLADVSTIVTPASPDGRVISLVLAPKGKNQKQQH